MNRNGSCRVHLKIRAQVAKYLVIAVAALVGLALVYPAIWWVSLPRYEGETVLYWFRAERQAALFRSCGQVAN